MNAKNDNEISKETAETLKLQFDLFQRYKVISDMINTFRKNKEIFKILEIGAGGEETLKKFLPRDNFIFLDKELLPENGQKNNYILGDITEMHIAESYDFVVSTDTYEHIHPSSRKRFINELIQPSTIATIIAAPFDTLGVKESEVIVNEAYVLTYGIEHRWLHEHIQNGLPSLSYTLGLIEKLGLNYTVIPNGYLPRWIDMISTYLLTEGMQEFSKIIEELSVFYNKNLYQYDSISPAYRQVIIIIKEGQNPDFSDILTKDFNSVDFKIKYEMLQSVLTNIRALYNPYRYNQIKTLENNLQEKERQINELNAAVQGRNEHIQNFERQITDISSHLSELNTALQGKDDQIRIFDEKITDISGHLSELNTAILGKDEQIRHLKGQITNTSGQLKEKEQQIEELNVAVREKDTQLRNFDELKTTFSSYIKEKDKHMDELDITIQEADEQIRDLEGQITDIFGRQKEKEQRITELNVALQGKDKQILNLDGQIADISGQRKEREERLGEIEMQNVRIDSELNSIKSSRIWRTLMKWHSFVENVMPQGTKRRKWYDQRLIRLRTSANEDGGISSWNNKEHGCSKKREAVTMKENIKLFPFKPISSALRNIVYFAMDSVDLLLGRRDMLTPPRRLALLAGGGDSQKIGEEFLRYFIELGSLKPNEKVLDIGSSIGRMAAPLTKYLDENGSYEGFDIVIEGVDWCKRKISPRYPNFHFQLADVFNKNYNPEGKYRAAEYRFPYKKESFDFVFLTSVFTHMLPHDIENYISEIARVLRKDGRCLITFFLLNKESLKHIETKKSTLDLKFVFDEYRTIDKDTPEAAIAYEEQFIRGFYDKYGLIIKEPTYYGSWSGRKEFLSYQDIIIATRG